MVCYVTKIQLEKNNRFLVCTGSITCAEQNRQCNEIFDGCNEIICGQCGDEQYCDKGYCKQLCRPVTNCIIAGAKCGTIFNGCDNTDCGTCANNEACKDGICGMFLLIIFILIY